MKRLQRSWPALVVVGLLLFAFAVIRSGVNLTSLPAVGGVGGDTYDLKIEVDDALNLPDNAFVRLGGADVGNVEDISTEGYHAVLEVRIRKDVVLPIGTTAELRQATPLGDVFVALTAPQKASRGNLVAGSTIGRDDTRSAPQIEDLLAAAAVVVNGGAITDLGAVVHELDAAMAGNGGNVRGLTRSVGQLAAVLNKRSSEIDQVLADLRQTTRLLRDNRDVIRKGLADFGPAIAVVASERDQILELGRKIQRLSGPIQRIVRASSGDLISSIDGTADALNGLADIGNELAPTLRDMLVLADVVDFSTRGENLAGVGYLRISPTLIQSIIDLATGTVTGPLAESRTGGAP